MADAACLDLDQHLTGRRPRHVDVGDSKRRFLDRSRRVEQYGFHVMQRRRGGWDDSGMVEDRLSRSESGFIVLPMAAGFVFGLLPLLVPSQFASAGGFPGNDTYVYRLAGAATLGYGGTGDDASGRRAGELVICQRYGWTYDELMETPEDVVNDIIELLNAEADAEKMRHRGQ